MRAQRMHHNLISIASCRAADRRTMDSIVESILSANLGPKWTQLYSRLGLGPRDRYRFETSHSGKESEERFTCCLRDTLEKWRSTVVIDKDEQDAIKLLLRALASVQGYQDVARELSTAQGIELHPSDDSGREEVDTPCLTPSFDLEHCPPVSLHKLSKATEVEIDHAEFHPRSFQDSDQKYPSIRVQGASNYTQTGTQLSGEHPGTFEAKINVVPNSHNAAVVDLANTLHKYTVLDICQRIRLPRETWKLFAKALFLPQDTIDELMREEDVEERNYLAIKNWVTHEAHTFIEVQGILKNFSCDHALSAMEARFRLSSK